MLDTGSIIPQGQAEGVREIVHGWVLGLDSWELAGLERAVLAGKGLLGAARLIAEWSEGMAGVHSADARPREGQEGIFGVEEAARAASIEVDWQDWPMGRC